MATRTEMIESSSVAPEVIGKVKSTTKNYKCILICLDSNHTHEHVIKEMEAYAQLTSLDSYCVVFDAIIDHMPAEIFPNRPWGPVITQRLQ